MSQYENCSSCGGEVEEELVKVDYYLEGKHYVLRGIPAGVCKKCGDRYFKGDITEAMQEQVKKQQVVR